MILPNPSDEQKLVIDTLQTCNIIVDSVAGSGKTTTILHIANTYNTADILLLTYNSNLKMETRKKIETCKTTNLEAHSYHSFCRKYYKDPCITDDQLKKILFENTPVQENNIIYFDMIIIDEAQDMSPVYYELVCKILADNEQKNVRMCLLGDKYQSIYGFKGTDERYLTLANKIFQINHKWEKLSLETSYRLTRENAKFVNQSMLKSNRIKSVKSGLKPTYIICNMYNYKIRNDFAKMIYLLLGEKDVNGKNVYKPSDIFILGPSVKTFDTPMMLLENTIKNTKKDKYPIYVPSSDNEEIDKKVMDYKIVFATFHQTKGLERKIVILFTFDDSYAQFYNKNMDKNICPNILYVAATRAREKLIIVHNYKFDYLSFVDIMKIKETSEIRGNLISKVQHNTCIDSGYSVTSLIKFIDLITEKCLSMLNISKSNEDELIDVPIKTENKKKLIELTSEINGVFIPNYYKYLKTGKIDMFNDMSGDPKYKSKFRNFIPKINELKKKSKLTISEFLYITNIYCSHKSGYLFKSYQIDDYNWIKEDIIQKCFDRLDSQIGKKIYNSEMEKYYISTVELNENYVNVKMNTKTKVNTKMNTKMNTNISIYGYVDYLDDENLYEFKCVKKIKTEHILQLAIYMWLDKKKNPNIKRKYILYNVLTNEKVTISAELEKLDIMMKLLVENKYKPEEKISDNEFIENMLKIKNRYKI